MATIHDWNKYMNLLHEMALVEDDLRAVVAYREFGGEVDGIGVAERVLYERFGVDSP